METPAATEPAAPASAPPARNALIAHPPGTRFGRLVVLRQEGREFDCLCDCGTEKRVQGTRLRRGAVSSCGCKTLEYDSRRTHGMTDTPEHAAWSNMLARCRNPAHPGWADYGGRGITVCARWVDSFEAFYADMGPRPFPGATLERADNGGPYAPGNVFWATYKEQAINRRNTARATLNGETLSLVEWGARFGIRPNMIWQRLRRGIPIELAVAPPLASRKGAKDGGHADYAAALATRHPAQASA